MSSSFRSAAAVVLLGGALCASPASFAQQSYFIPRVEVGAEWDSNRELTSDSSRVQSTESYRAQLEARMGRRTERSETELRPRVIVQEFPSRSGVDAVEGFLDLHSGYESPRTQMSVEGQYARQDTINAEYGQAQFDPAHPGDPQSGDTGLILVGHTRTSVDVLPTIEHELTERLGVEGTLRYQSVSYDSDTTTQSGYDYGRAGVSLTERLSQRTLLAVGPYYSRYEADHNVEQSDSYGASIDLRHEWSEVSYVLVSLSGERSQNTQLQPVRQDSSATSWGLQFTGYTRYRVGYVRYSIGRFLTPSTLGSRRQVDQLRVEYQRPLSPLMSFTGAVRYWKDQHIGNLGGGGDGNRARADLTLTRQLTRTWALALSYRYAWQDINTSSGSAENHAAFLSFGYHGLDPIGKVFDERIRRH
jgi:hypothetical protein